MSRLPLRLILTDFAVQDSTGRLPASASGLWKLLCRRGKLPLQSPVFLCRGDALESIQARLGVTYHHLSMSDWRRG